VVTIVFNITRGHEVEIRPESQKINGMDFTKSRLGKAKKHRSERYFVRVGELSADSQRFLRASYR
jgi:hypothetical protein